MTEGGVARVTLGCQFYEPADLGPFSKPISLSETRSCRPTPMDRPARAVRRSCRCT